MAAYSITRKSSTWIYLLEDVTAKGYNWSFNQELKVTLIRKPSKNLNQI